ncbi:MAG: Amuc_1100 family pilus-like protein [Puniceicoccales bacterium]|jgi:hypothetical protein|nr:Amuc_1100 family pilus-like protein [Puniceicoccales bacterium]
MSLKYPVFTSFISFFGAACLVGVAAASWQVVKYNGLHKSIEIRERDLRRILASDVSPTQGNRSAAADNYIAAKSRAKELLDYIRGTRRFNPDAPRQFAELVSSIRGTVNDLTARLEKSKVRIFSPNAGRPGEGAFSYGFRRYIANTDGAPPQRMQDIAKECEIVRFLVDSLASAKTNVASTAPVILQSVLREPVELSVDKTPGFGGRSLYADEYNPKPEERILRPGLVKSYYFRIVFTGRTDVLRNYLNSIYAVGYPIFLREIGVSPAKPDVLAVDTAASTTAPAAVAGAGVTADAPPPSPALDPEFSAPPPLTLPDAGVSSAPPPPSVSTAKTSNVQMVLDGSPAEFTLSFEYVEPLEGVFEPAAKGSSND